MGCTIMKVFSMEHVMKTQGKSFFLKMYLFPLPKGKNRIVGINGTGKSTLLNIIAGLEDSDLGTKDHPNDYTISYLSQDRNLMRN